MRSAVTISLVPEARGGPFVFWDDLAAACRKAKEFGFDAVEIFPRAIEDLKVGELKTILAEHDLQLAAMGTGAGWVAHKLRFTDPTAETRQQACEFAAAIIDFAAEFGAPAIVGSMQGRCDPGISREQSLQWLAEAIEVLAGRAASRKTELWIEPLNRYETNLLNSVDQSVDFLKNLRAQNVKLLCDLFHMNIEEADIAASLRRAGDHVGHIHFADSNRRAVGWGHTPIEPIVGALRGIRYDRYISGEVLPLPDSDAAARQTIASIKTWFG